MSALISQGRGKPFGWQIGLQHIFNDIKCKEMSRKIENYFSQNMTLTNLTQI